MNQRFFRGHCSPSRGKDNHMLYASGSRGFRAAVFIPSALPEASIYDEEHTWNAEGG